MARKTTWIRKLFDESNLPEESVGRESVVEILGDGRVLIENHSGVTHYCTDVIEVKVRYGAVCVAGCNLRLRLMSAEKLVVNGTIERVELIRRRV